MRKETTESSPTTNTNLVPCCSMIARCGTRTASSNSSTWSRHRGRTVPALRRPAGLGKEAMSSSVPVDSSTARSPKTILPVNS